MKRDKLQWTELVILGAVPFVMVLGNSMLIPVFPKFEEVLNINQVKVGLLVTAFSLPAGLLIPFSGMLSDRIGRKIIIAPALILYGLGGLVAGIASVALAKPFTVILVGRVVQGLGAEVRISWPWPLLPIWLLAKGLPGIWDFSRPPMGWGKLLVPF